MPRRKLLMVLQKNVCRAIGISTDKTQTILDISKKMLHFKLTLILCCGQFLTYRIGYNHCLRPLIPDLYKCTWFQWIWYTLVNREPLPSDTHNLDCSQSCISSWQGLGEGWWCRRYSTSCSTKWGRVWLVWRSHWQTSYHGMCICIVCEYIQWGEIWDIIQM